MLCFAERPLAAPADGAFKGSTPDDVNFPMDFRVARLVVGGVLTCIGSYREVKCHDMFASMLINAHPVDVLASAKGS